MREKETVSTESSILEQNAHADTSTLTQFWTGTSDWTRQLIQGIYSAKPIETYTYKTGFTTNY